MPLVSQAGDLRVQETPTGLLVRLPLNHSDPAAVRVMSRGDTLVIAGAGGTRSIRLPRPANASRISAREASGILFINVPLERTLQPSWRLSAPSAPSRPTVAPPSPTEAEASGQRRRARIGQE